MRSLSITSVILHVEKYSHEWQIFISWHLGVDANVTSCKDYCVHVSSLLQLFRRFFETLIALLSIPSVFHNYSIFCLPKHASDDGTCSSSYNDETKKVYSHVYCCEMLSSYVLYFPVQTYYRESHVMGKISSRVIRRYICF